MRSPWPGDALANLHHFTPKCRKFWHLSSHVRGFLTRFRKPFVAGRIMPSRGANCGARVRNYEVRTGWDMKAFEIGGIALEPARMGIPLLACEGDIIVSPPLPERTARAHLALARELYSARRRRERFFPADLFGEAAWDILLDLYIARHEKREVATTSACIGAYVPPTTALRWLRHLMEHDYVHREDDGKDRRRTFVRLSAKGNAAMDAFLANMLKTMARNLGAVLMVEMEGDCQ